MDAKKQKKVYVAMSGGVDSSVAAALLKEQGYSVVGVFMKFWSPGTEGDSPLRGTVPKHLGGERPRRFSGSEVRGGGYCIWKEERADAARVAAKLGIPLLTWDFTKEYGEKVVAYMLEAYEAGITPNPDIMCNKEIKFGLFFDKAMAEGADLIATGHYARIAKSEIRNPKRISNDQNPNVKTGVILSDVSGAKNPVVRMRSFASYTQDDRDGSNNYHLLKAVDLSKDQSYFLYTLDQHHLKKTLFPIGEYTKPEVRALARKFGLPTAEKKDSQGVCFIGPLKMKEFLKDYIKPKRGKIISQTASQPDSLTSSRLRGASKSDKNSNKAVQLSSCPADKLIGEHDGAWYYTIGQRHGIDIKDGGGPYYVIGKDVEKNEIYVGGEDDLYSDQAWVTNVHWIGAVPKLPTGAGVKIRYRSKTVKTRIMNNELRIMDNLQPDKKETLIHNSKLIIRFDQPVKAIAPGQAAVFYDGEKVLGGGIIE